MNRPYTGIPLFDFSTVDREAPKYRDRGMVIGFLRF